MANKRTKDLRSPLSKWVEWLVQVAQRPFASISVGQKFWIAFAVFCVVTTFLIHNPFWRAAGEHQYKEGDIARESIIVPADVIYTDNEQSDRLKEESRRAVKPIFRYESNKTEQAIQRFVSSWEKLQRHGGESENSKQSNSDTKAETHWTGAGGPEVGKTLAARVFSRNELEAVQSALKESAEGYIFDDSEKQYFQNEVFVFDRSKPNLQTNVSMPESNWTPLSTAREKFKTRLSSIKSLSPKESDAFYTAGEILVEPSVSYDSVATDTARQAAADSIEPRTVSLKRGQKIADEGDIVTDAMLSKITA